MGNAYLKRMPAGIPGVLSRTGVGETIETQIMDPNTPVTAFGVFVKLVNGLVQPIASGDAAAVVYGMLTKPYPYQEPSSNEALGAATPNPALPCDVLKRGYMPVLFGGVTAAKGGQVYVRVTAAGGKLVGSIEEGAAAGACVAVAGCFFMGPADANGIVEVAFNL